MRTPSPTPRSIPGLPIEPRRAPFHLQKTLVLDLDETLIHSTSRPFNSSGSGYGLLGFSFGRRNKNSHTVEVNLGGKTTLYHVYKRPFVDFFLRKVRLRFSFRRLRALLIPSGPCRYLRGTRSWFSLHRCRNMPIRSSIGSMQERGFFLVVYSERYVVTPVGISHDVDGAYATAVMYTVAERIV